MTLAAKPPSFLTSGTLGILLDMDGVLIDSEPLHEMTLLKLSEQFGRRFEQHAELQAFKGLPELSVGRLLLKLFPHVTLTPAEVVNLRLEKVRENFSAVRMIEGARLFLERCKAANLRLALTTSADPSIQQLAFASFRLSEFFDAVVTGKDVTKGKPDPEPYQLTATKLGVPADRCIVIEDAVSGVLSGKAAGCRVVALTTSFTKPVLLAAGADLVVESFAALEASFFGKHVEDRVQ